MYLFIYLFLPHTVLYAWLQGPLGLLPCELKSVAVWRAVLFFYWETCLTIYSGSFTGGSLVFLQLPRTYRTTGLIRAVWYGHQRRAWNQLQLNSDWIVQAFEKCTCLNIMQKQPHLNLVPHCIRDVFAPVYGCEPYEINPPPWCTGSVWNAGLLLLSCCFLAHTVLPPLCGETWSETASIVRTKSIWNMAWSR